MSHECREFRTLDQFDASPRNLFDNPPKLRDLRQHVQET